MSPHSGSLAGPREIELKFLLPPGSRTGLEAHPVLAAAAAVQSRLVTTYFDTPDGRLKRAGLTLRVRRCDEGRIQTVKSEPNGESLAVDRVEWEWPIDQDTPDTAKLATIKPIKALGSALDGGLQPMFVADIQRHTLRIRLDEATVVEVAFDEGTIAAGPRTEAVSEIELELKSGRVGALYRLAATLQAAAPLCLSSETKAARGWRLRSGQGEGAAPAQPVKLNRKIRADEAFRQLLSQALGHLRANIGPMLRGNVEGLHQSRVAIREARAVLQLFAPYLDGASAKRFASRLRDYGVILGEARDWDVFCLETIPAAIADRPAESWNRLRAAAEFERGQAHEAVTLAARGSEVTQLVLGLMTWAEDGAIKPSCRANLRRRRLADLAPFLLERPAARVRRKGRDVGRLSQEARHDLRKSLKKLRYDVGYLGCFYPKDEVRRYRRRSKAVEEMLGPANDAVVARQLARRLEAAHPAEVSQAAEALESWCEARERKALRGVEAAIHDLRRARPFWE